MQVLQPQSARTLVWASLRSLAATSRISIDLFSGRYLDVSVPYVGSSSTTLLMEGSSDLSISGVAPFRNLRVEGWLSPHRSLSQINRVFHRLLLPRYPPHALNSFILAFILVSYLKNYYMVLVYLLILLCDCQRTTDIWKIKMVGLARLELATPSLSGTYSNHLSYNPTLIRIYRRQLSTHKCFSKSLWWDDDESIKTEWLTR